ncbi:MAG: hypothetical protein GY807_20275 [Gammaproteobacteria bacterium]|nr:hypothetical protein [Gammaproteobacteria bacterium]
MTPIFSHSQILAYVDNKNTIRRWNIKKGQTESPIKHKYKILALAFSPNGEWIVSLDNKKDIRFWSQQEPSINLRILSSEDQTNRHAREKNISLAFRDDNTLITGSEVGTVRRWDLKSLVTVDQEPINKQDVEKTKEVKDIILADSDLKELYRHLSPVKQILVHNQANRLITLAENSRIMVWEFKHSPLAKPTIYIHQKSSKEEYVRVVRFSPDGKQLASGGAASGLKTWLVEGSGKLEPITKVVRGDNIRALAYSADGKRIVLAKGSKKPDMVKNLDNSKDSFLLKGYRDGRWAAAFQPGKENIVATASWDGTVRVWDLDDKPAKAGLKPLCTLKHGGSILALAFSNDGHYLYSGGRDGFLHRWDTRLLTKNDECEVGIEPERAKAIPIPANINTIGINVKGDLLATAGEDGAIRLYSIANDEFHEEPKHILRDHEGSVNDIVFSTDGEWLVSRKRRQDRQIVVHGGSGCRSYCIAQS